MTHEQEIEFNQKKQAIKEKFTKSFFEAKYMYHAEFHKIVQMLIRDANPYEIIEALINNQELLTKQLFEALQTSNANTIHQ